MPNIRHYDDMLFNYETTNRVSFRNGDIKIYEKTEYQNKPPPNRAPYIPLKDFCTLSEFKTRDFPTELFVKAKDIVRTNPKKTQEPYNKPVDEVRRNVQATRPRLVMTPALSMDDIEDTSIRELLLKDVYKTAANNMQEDVEFSSGSSRVPLTGQLSPANPFKLPKLQMPFVHPEWRMDSVTWDNRQTRGHCDPDKKFYLSRTLRCDACDFTTAREMKKRFKTSRNN